MYDPQQITLLLKGGGAALLLLLAVRFWVREERSCVEYLGVWYCTLGALHILTQHSVPIAQMGSAARVVAFLGQLDAAVFWALAHCLFDDKLRLRLWHGVPLVTLAILWWLPGGDDLGRVVTVLLMAHVAYIGLRDYHSDLVDARRRFRLALAVLVPAMVISTMLTDLFVQRDPLTRDLIDAVKFSGLALLFAVWMTRLDRMLVGGRTHQPRPEPRAIPVADRLELDRIRQVVQQGVCFEPGLTIGALAARVDIPEHRLRKLINQGLGYRNFAAFLNDHRIEEAKRRLADPTQAREQIISHAFALGYNSLAPFNRAFRERVGQSPTEYRASMLQDAIA